MLNVYTETAIIDLQINRSIKNFTNKLRYVFFINPRRAQLNPYVSGFDTFRYNGFKSLNVYLINMIVCRRFLSGGKLFPYISR